MGRRYEFYVLVARTMPQSFAALTREIFFLPREHKIHIFSPLFNILYILQASIMVWRRTCAGVLHFELSKKIDQLPYNEYYSSFHTHLSYWGLVYNETPLK